MSKFMKKLKDSFSRTDSTRYVYLLLTWPNFRPVFLPKLDKVAFSCGDLYCTSSNFFYVSFDVHKKMPRACARGTSYQVTLPSSWKPSSPRLPPSLASSSLQLLREPSARPSPSWQNPRPRRFPSLETPCCGARY